jgi:hypothetical protein
MVDEDVQLMNSTIPTQILSMLFYLSRNSGFFYALQESAVFGTSPISVCTGILGLLERVLKDGVDVTLQASVQACFHFCYFVTKLCECLVSVTSTTASNPLSAVELVTSDWKRLEKAETVIWTAEHRHRIFNLLLSKIYYYGYPFIYVVYSG